MSGIRRTIDRRIPRGFTVVEVAIAIVIIAILLGSIMVPLQAQIESRKIDETNRILEQAREALLGYAAATGRFPCPASTINGMEAPGSDPITGVCAATVTYGTSPNFIYLGFLPAARLGFTPTDGNGHALDAWGLTQNRIRYAVAGMTVGGVARPFTTLPNPPANTLGMRAAGMSNITNAALLYVCNSGTGVIAGANCGTAVTLTSNAIAVIWSVGPNAPTGGASVHEAENPNPNGGSADRIFVSRPRSAGTAGDFDDIVTWIGAPTLFNRLIASGQLP